MACYWETEKIKIGIEKKKDILACAAMTRRPFWQGRGTKYKGIK